MVTINFTSAGGTQDVSYSMSCNKKPTFDVPDEYKSWLKINSVSSTEPKITISAHTYESTSSAERTGYIVAKIGNDTCGGEKRLMVVQDGGGEQTTKILWNENTNLLTTGEVKRRAAVVTTNDPNFDVNDLSINTPEWITTEVEKTSSTGQYNVYFTYGYTPISRDAIVGASYRSASVAGGQTDFNQNGELYQEGLSFKITKSQLNPCGNGYDEIGEYYYDGDVFGYVQNTSFTCTTKPDWVLGVIFGVPDANSKKGKIYADYSKNTSSEQRIWNNIKITYSGYQDVQPKSGSISRMTQDVPQGGVGTCGAASNPGTAPTTCSEANFYHWDNPYVPGDLSYYYLEHHVSAYEQTYTLRTCADFCKYITREDGSKIPVITINDPMWKDVRVEIWDVVPDIVHNSACGLHHVEVQPGDSFATIKKRHTSGDSQSTCACPCYFNGWNPNNGAYEIYGTKETALIAVYEDGNLNTSETDEEAYSNFWLKATDCSHTYSSANGWRELNFTVERNTGAGAYDRCAVIKVYPKINGVYCTNDCQDCERTARCQNERNCCLTDMVIQESVNCSDTNEYFDPNHAYFNKYITSEYNESLTNQMLYDYWWGPCNDCWNGDNLAENCDNTTTSYINAVDVYDATMIDYCDDGQSAKTDTCSANISGGYLIGDYLGTVYADGVYGGTDGRTQLINDSVITDISITSKWDSDDNQYRGYITFSANAYAPSGEIYKYGDPKRYRVRILVPYHKGVDYSTGNSGCFFTKNEKFWLYYGPESINHPSGGTYEWKGLTNGEFCVLRQDGLDKGNV